MTALVDALDFDPAARRRRLLGGGLLFAAFAGLVAFSATRFGDAKDPCTIDRSALGDAWTESRKGSVHEAIKATGVAYAEDVWTRFDQTVNAYQDRWLSERLDTCEATHVRKEQSPAVLDLRMRCLDGRRIQLDAVTGPSLACVSGAFAGRRRGIVGQAE